MGLMLFSGDDGKKKVSALSGGEAARLIFSRLALDKPNVLVLDEPTNHLDLESIEALVAALQKFEGTLILVSHDRWFVSRIATRVVEIKADEILDYHGTYEEYVHFSGDDHLDADTVILKARREKHKKGREGRKGGKRKRDAGASAATRSPANVDRRVKKLEFSRDHLTESIEAAEARIAEIDATFCEVGYYERTAPDVVATLESERGTLRGEVDRHMERWSEIEREIEELRGDAAPAAR